MGARTLYLQHVHHVLFFIQPFPARPRSPFPACSRLYSLGIGLAVQQILADVLDDTVGQEVSVQRTNGRRLAHFIGRLETRRAHLILMPRRTNSLTLVEEMSL